MLFLSVDKILLFLEDLAKSIFGGFYFLRGILILFF
jgi:hypothetical protein